MATPAPLKGSAFVIGANHRTSGLSLRDRLFVADADVPAFLRKLSGIGITDALVLATCDRVEVQGIHVDPHSLLPLVSGFFAEHAGVTEEEVSGIFYIHSGPDAVRHIFSVAASLDSLVVGEPQVFGQIKAAHRIAKNVGMIQGPFEGLLQSAYSAAKRVRTETTIGERPVSIASAACEIARELHGDLSRLFVVMIGAGEMGELMARQFQGNGVKGLTLCHPNASRVEPLALRLGCHIFPHDNLSGALAEADIVICAMGSRRHSLNSDMVRAALKARRRRPQLIIDTGIPGDVEPAVNRIDDAFLYELADLERVALQGRTNREAEADAAWRLIEDEVATYLLDNASRDAVPALTQMYAYFEDMRQMVLRENPKDATRATELLVARLLHNPSLILRELATRQTGEIANAEHLLRLLFELKPTTDSNDNKKETKG